MKQVKRYIFDDMILVFIYIFILIAGPQSYLDCLNSSEATKLIHGFFGLIGYYFICITAGPLFYTYIRYIIDIIVKKAHTTTITVIKDAIPIRYTIDYNQEYYCVKVVTNNNKTKILKIDEDLIKNIQIHKGKKYIVTYYIFSNVVDFIEKG